VSIRKERSKANKAAYALARKINFAADLEQVQLPDTAPELLPEEECNGYVRRRARGAKTDAHRALPSRRHYIPKADAKANGARFASFGMDEIALRGIGSINFCEKSTSERGDAVIE
jgi:hypothetical protein